MTIKFSAARVTTTGSRSRLTQLKIPMLLLLLLLPPHRYSDNNKDGNYDYDDEGNDNVDRDC